MDSLNSFASIINAENFLNYATYFCHLLKTKTGTDVIFVLDTPDSGEVEFHAHQLVLAMRSSHFADLFYGSCRNNEDPFQKIRLRRINPKALEDMIRYCYGCQPGLENPEETCALFKVANMFKVGSLMNLCRICLRDINIKPGNIFNVLEVAQFMADKNLKDKCDKLLVERTREVIASYDLLDVTPVMVHIIIELPQLALYSEYELINWILEWATAKVKEGDSGCTDAREYLQKLLQDMNFLGLTFEEFAMLCNDFPNFFCLTEIALVYLNIAHPGTREMPDWYKRDLKIRKYTGSKK